MRGLVVNPCVLQNLVDAVRIERTFMLETCHGQAIYAHSYQLLHPNLVPLLGVEPRTTSPFERDDFANLSTGALILYGGS